MRTPVARAALLSVALLIPACSGSGMKPTYPVAGRVTVQGKPAAKAVVGFHPTGENAAARPQILPNADCDADGRFTLSTYLKGDGAPEGEYAVTVFWAETRPSPDAEPGDEDDEEQRGEVRNRLPDEYGRKETTPLRFTVKPGEDNAAVFDIK